MKRRTFLAAAGLAAMGLGRGVARAAPAERPNLLVIHTDEHNFRTVGCYRALMPPEEAFVWGREAVCPTPNIDRLAREGAVCLRFYATTPVCSPSRSALVSGLYPQHTPVVTNNIPMRDGVVTFAEVLRRHGYATGYAGKWHLDGPAKPGWAPRRKFGFTDNRYMFNRGHWKQLEETPRGPRVKARRGGRPTYDVRGADATSYTTDFLADRTVEFIRAHADRPFCWMVSFPDPHGPNTVRPPYDTMFSHLRFEDPPSMHKPPESVPPWAPKVVNRLEQGQMARYFGMVKCIDDNVGKILRALEAAGVLERTVVVFTSDHGDLCGEHGRHNKGVPLEASARVPMVVRYPARIPPGTVVREALGCVDFTPTVLALMGIEAPAGCQGRDASALLAAGRAPAGWQDVAFLRSTGTAEKGAAWLAAVTRRFKLVVATAGDPWLFDLAKDPHEMTNRYADPACREVVRDLARALLDYAERFEDPYARRPGLRRALLEAAGSAKAT